MAKSIHDDVLDAALEYIGANGDEITVCSAQPTNYTEAHTTYKLADQVLSTGDYSYGDGDSSGRKVTVAQQADITIDTTDTATHIAITDTGQSKLLLVTTCTSQALTQGNTVTIPAFDDEIADPA